MVVRDQREDTVARRFRDESFVIDVIRQLKASTRFLHISRLIVRSAPAVLTVPLFSSLFDLRDDPVLSATSVEDILGGIRD
jgi:hypothetical protein